MEATALNVSQVAVEHAFTEDPVQLIATDADGKEHSPTDINVLILPANVTMRCTFDLPADSIQKVLLQSKPFVTFVDMIALVARGGVTTQPRLSVRRAKR